MTPIVYTKLVDSDQIVSFPGATFRMYYLEASISILGKSTPKSLNNNIVGLNFNHVGVGFQAFCPSKPYFRTEFTLDFELLTGFTFDALIPKIIDGEVVWDNEGEVLIGNFIDRNYWTRADYIGEVTNDQVVAVQQWVIDTWNVNMLMYSLFSGCDPDAEGNPSRENLFDPYMKSSTCNDFAYDVFDFFINLKVCINYAVPPMTNVNAFVVPRAEAKEVEYEVYKSAIVEYYTSLRANLESLLDLFTQIEALIAEIKVAPIDEIPALILELGLLFVETLVKIGELYIEYEVVYYYGYWTDGSIGYWKYEKPPLFVNYIESNLYRSYPALTTEGKNVIDSYTAESQDCVPIAGCCEPVKCCHKGTNWGLWIALILILLVLVVFFILYLTMGRKTATKTLL